MHQNPTGQNDTHPDQWPSPGFTETPHCCAGEESLGWGLESWLQVFESWGIRCRKDEQDQPQHDGYRVREEDIRLPRGP